MQNLNYLHQRLWNLRAKLYYGNPENLWLMSLLFKSSFNNQNKKYDKPHIPKGRWCIKGNCLLLEIITENIYLTGLQSCSQEANKSWLTLASLVYLSSLPQEHPEPEVSLDCEVIIQPGLDTSKRIDYSPRSILIAYWNLETCI